jgi:hypothetical protein
MRALLVPIVVVAGLGLGGPGAAAQDATPAAAARVERTDVRYFLPFGPDGLNPQLAVAGEASGFCTEGSLANIGRPDAWFCLEAETNAVHDPCYENPFGPIDEPATLACAASPFADEVVLFTATEPLRRQKDVSAVTNGSADAPDGATNPGQDGAAGPNPVSPIDGPAADPDGGGVAAEEAIDPLALPWAVELADGERCGLLTGATAAVAGMRLNYGCEGGGWLVGDLDRGSPVWTANFYDERALATELVEVATVWT